MEHVNFKLSGRSGCNLDLIAEHNSFIVRKYSKNSGYNQRLVLQAEKQKGFREFGIFRAPDIIQIINDELVYFDMKYVAGEKYSEYFGRITKQELDGFISNIIDYLNNNISNSEITIPDNTIFIKKVNSLQQELGSGNAEVNNLLNKLIKNIPETPIPHGNCHGDLTFSNMIFSGGRIYLIDFLDSFFNSPMIDIVKLRQDTSFFWTLLIDNELELFKRNKMRQIMGYIDTQLIKAFSSYSFFNPWYNYLQSFNLLRILPYIKVQQERELVSKALKTIQL